MKRETDGGVKGDRHYRGSCLEGEGVNWSGQKGKPRRGKRGDLEQQKKKERKKYHQQVVERGGKKYKKENSGRGRGCGRKDTGWKKKKAAIPRKRAG